MIFGTVYRFIRPRLAWVLLFLLLFFVVFAYLDIVVSGLFYDLDAGVWILHDNAVIEFLRRGFLLADKIILAAVVILYLVFEISKKQIAIINRKSFSLILLVAALGVGLLVNGILKNNFDRARPEAVVQLGGDKVFTPAFMITDQCETNCSFVSGDASACFWIFCLAILIKNSRYRRIAIDLSLFYGLTMGAFRIMQGKHFLSDIIFAGAIMIILTLVLYRYIYGSQAYKQLEQNF
jgi:lipid A 4'-phosphatase